jgi:hypothetical protein
MTVIGGTATKIYEPVFQDLDVAEWNGGSILIHSPWGNGKTHLLGDFLRYNSQFGPVAYVNFKGEDGYDTIHQLGLGKVRVDVSSYDEWRAFLDWAEKKKYQAIGYDSLKEAFNLTIEKKTKGAERAPLVGDYKSNEWPDIHSWMRYGMLQSNRVAQYVMWVCPTDTGQDRMEEIASGLKKDTPKLFPDLPGKGAAGAVSWFKLVGYLFADYTKEGTKRNIDFRPSDRYITRQRMPAKFGGIDKLIPIPKDEGGWKNILDAIQAAYAKGVVNG